MPLEIQKVGHANITISGIVIIKNLMKRVAHSTNMRALVALRSPVRHLCSQSQCHDKQERQSKND